MNAMKKVREVVAPPARFLQSRTSTEKLLIEIRDLLKVRLMTLSPSFMTGDSTWHYTPKPRHFSNNWQFDRKQVRAIDAFADRNHTSSDLSHNRKYAPRPNPPVLWRSIENRNIERPDGTDLPIRVYVPQGTEPFGVCLYFHGGGWVLNNIDTHDDLVRRLAAASGCVFVTAVDYRLAPEHKYPAATEDAYTALKWVHDRTQPRLAATRKSNRRCWRQAAGGNLGAAVLCLMSRDRRGPKIAFQALIYPITDCDFQPTLILVTNGEGYFLTRRETIWFLEPICRNTRPNA